MRKAAIAFVVLMLLVATFAIFVLPLGLLNQLMPSPVEAREITVPELTSKINNFTLKLYGELLGNNWKRNIVVSPFNVYVALTLLYEGANGTTRTEMGEVLDLIGVDPRNAYQQLLDSLPLSMDDDTALIIANAVWLREGFPFKTKYVETVKKYYKAEVKYFDNVPQLVIEVNNWVSEKTRGLIKDILNPNAVSEDVVAVLVSAIYFKGEWVEKFKPIGPFKFWTGEEYVNAPGMEVISDVVKVVHGADYTAVEIPYKNTNITMVIIIPEKYTDIPSKYEELILDALRRLDRANTRKTVWLIMPKFNISLKTNMVSHLQNMGIVEVFTPGKADLTRMANVKVGEIWADKIIHQAVIKVNEEGTEATAATVIVVVTGLPQADEKVVVNKPFIYILRDKKTNTILFIGHVINPIESE